MIESRALNSVKEVKGSCYSVVRVLFLFSLRTGHKPVKQPKGTRLQEKEVRSFQRPFRR